MKIVTCSVPGCYSVIFPTMCQSFPNPLFPHSIYNKWVHAIRNEELDNMDPQEVFKTKGICNRHFTDDCFDRNRILKCTAVPNKHLLEERPISMLVDLPPSADVENHLLSPDDFTKYDKNDVLLSSNDSDSDSDSSQVSFRKSAIDRDGIHVKKEITKKIMIDETCTWAISAEEFKLPCKSQISKYHKNSDSNNCVVLITEECLNNFREMEKVKDKPINLFVFEHPNLINYDSIVAAGSEENPNFCREVELVENEIIIGMDDVMENNYETTINTNNAESHSERKLQKINHIDSNDQNRLKYQVDKIDRNNIKRVYKGKNKSNDNKINEYNVEFMDDSYNISSCVGTTNKCRNKEHLQCHKCGLWFLTKVGLNDHESSETNCILGSNSLFS